MEIKVSTCSDGTAIFIVTYPRQGAIAEFTTAAAAEKYVRRMGHFVKYTK